MASLLILRRVNERFLFLRWYDKTFQKEKNGKREEITGKQRKKDRIARYFLISESPDSR